MPDNRINRRLRKNERISGAKEIETLFLQGKAFLAFPLRVVYKISDLETENAEPDAAILTSVSKKRFKKATDRNRIKRLIREAYRLNKHLLLSNPLLQKKQLRLSFVYIHREKLSFLEIEKGMTKALKGILQEIT